MAWTYNPRDSMAQMWLSARSSLDRIKPPHQSAPPPPSILEHLPYLEEELNRFQGSYPIFTGDLNIDVSRLQNTRNQHVANFLASFSWWTSSEISGGNYGSANHRRGGRYNRVIFPICA